MPPPEKLYVYEIEGRVNPPPELTAQDFLGCWREGSCSYLFFSTPREQEIMRLLAEGLSAKKIAEKLFISPKTVENHRTNIMSKLGLHSTMELVRYAAKLGLIDVDLWKE